MTDEAVANTGTTEPTAAPPPAEADQQAPADPTALSGAGEPDNGAATPANGDATAEGGSEPAAEPPDWPDDWRDRFLKKAKAEDRDKLSKRLNRFTSPDNVLSSYLEMERKLSSGALKPAAIGEDASEDDVAAYRKAWGVPETPEEYGLEFPEGLEVSDADKADLAEFAKVAHGMNAPPHIVKGMAEQYFAMQERAMQQMYDAAQEQTVNRRAEVKAEYGRDFDRNVRLAKADLASVISSEKAEELVSLTLSDGTKLGDHPDFIRYAVGAALRNADDEALVTSDLNSSGQTLEEQWSASLDLMNTDPKKFHSEEHQARHTALAKAITARRNKAA